jgi:hypothetical protein
MDFGENFFERLEEKFFPKGTVPKNSNYLSEIFYFGLSKEDK